MQNVNKILVISLQGIGDLLLASPLLHGLKNSLPQAQLSILTFLSNKDVLTNNPDVDEIIIFDPKYKNNIFKILIFLFNLRKKYFGLTICTYPSGLRSGFIGYLTGAKIRVGQGLSLFKNYPWLFTLKTEVKEIKHAIEMNLDLLNILGINTKGTSRDLIVNLSSEDRKFATEFLRNNGISSEDTLIAIHAAGGRYTARYRSWPKERFAQVADNLIEKVQAKILFIGGENEINIINDTICLMKNKPLSAVGKTTLMQMAALLEKSSLLICNNSAPMHIAAALKVPTVSIFGAADPKIHRPWGKGHIVLQKKLECSPCYYPFFRDTLEETRLRNSWSGKRFRCKTNDYRCLSSVTVEDVLNAAEAILKERVNK